MTCSLVHLSGSTRPTLGLGGLARTQVSARAYTANHVETRDGMARASQNTSIGATRMGPGFGKGEALAVRIQEPGTPRKKLALT